jgi:L-ascorbate metabolism protein UlaG (beta-lactamase superfamily)
MTMSRVGILTQFGIRRAQSSQGTGVTSDTLDPAGWSESRLTVANLGHATLLMNWFGMRLISDPTLFKRVGPSIGSLLTIGPRRRVERPLSPAKLQEIDIVLITHAHMDHLDLPSLAALNRGATVVAGQGCGALIRRLGFTDVRELGWGESTTVKEMRLEAMGARHWGVRWPPFGNAYGYNSYLLERRGVRMLLACDSAYTEMFAPVGQRPPDIAAFSIAAYDPWIRHHADPEQVWQMFRKTGARYLIPIHWGTFRLSREPMEEPMRRLLAAAGPEADRVLLRRIGVAWSLPK